MTYLHDNYGRAQCAFVMGKAHVGPLIPVTIPRIESTAAVMASRMDMLWRKELQMELRESISWTDGNFVLKYLKNEKSRLKIFVGNSVGNT